MYLLVYLDHDQTPALWPQEDQGTPQGTPEYKGRCAFPARPVYCGLEQEMTAPKLVEGREFSVYAGFRGDGNEKAPQIGGFQRFFCDWAMVPERGIEPRTY